MNTPVISDPVDKLVDLYNSSLSALIDVHAPLKEKCITLRPNTSWYTAELNDAKRQKRSLERRWRKTGSTVDHKLYRVQSAVMNKLLCRTKSQNSLQLIETAGKDQKKLFKTCKKLLGNTDKLKLPTFASDFELACSFNNFFKEKVDKIVNELKASQSAPQHPEHVQIVSSNTVPCFENFSQVTQDQVQKLIISCAPKSCALDPAPTWLVKTCIPELLPLITAIINSSLQSGSFPEVFKQPIVRPTIKDSNLDSEELSSYRPVSNLPFISKLIEKVVYEQLTTHIEHNALHDENQSGYRKYHSTESNIVKLTNDLLVSLDQGEVSLVIFLDVSAAFDAVNHQVLLERLKTLYGISGNALKWVSSYLENRSQIVCINGAYSDPVELDHGFPQGSVLGGGLYTWTVKPISDICKTYNVSHKKYADDKNLYVSFSLKVENDQEVAIGRLEKCMVDVKNWMIQNMLKINPGKTKMLMVASKKDLITLKDLTIDFDSIPLTYENNVRSLGFEFDSTLKMERQINFTTRSIYNNIRKTWRIRRSLNNFATKTIVNSLITSKLDLYNCMYYGLPNRLLGKLQRAQNSSARLIVQASKFCRITPVLKELHWLPVKERIVFKICLYVYKALNGLSPQYIRDMICERRLTTTRTLRSTSAQLLDIPRTNTVRYGDRAFSNCAPYLWNKLPIGIRNSETITAFKKQLKTHLFAQTYE